MINYVIFTYTTFNTKMAKITWMVEGNPDITANIENGLNLMQAAIANNVPYIHGECGGCLSCATCHVVIAPEWINKIGQPNEIEDIMLDMTDVERQYASRLSCQLEVTPDLDGLKLYVPVPK